MVKVMNFGEQMERDLARITHTVEAERAVTTESPAPAPELVRRSLEDLSGGVPAPTPAASPASSAPSDDHGGELPAYLAASAGDPKARQEVDRLVHLAFRDGIEAAVREAKRQPPFILDALHDALVDKLLPELKRRGVL